MAVILNIETSNSVCSVALSADGMILKHIEDDGGRNHAALISDFIKSMLDHCHEHEIKPEAVAVSLGPGSYTGLRIGLSEAKGLCYGADIPLIGLSTLEIMTVAVMFGAEDIDESTVFVPMLDARRMEVYTAAYDLSLNELLAPRALVLDTDTDAELSPEAYRRLLETGRKVLFFGNGMPKLRALWGNKAPANARFIEAGMSHCGFNPGQSADAVPARQVEPLAVDMVALAERAFSAKDFIDVAYSTPLYLKDFQATKPRNRLLE